MSSHLENQIYIRLLEGGESLVPVKAINVGLNLFKIIENSFLDLDEDMTSIWEFFPGDIVQTEQVDNLLVAKKLISSEFHNRTSHQLIFLIVESLGNLNLTTSQGFKDAVERFCNEKTSILQKEHPIVQKWIEKNCAKNI